MSLLKIYTSSKPKAKTKGKPTKAQVEAEANWVRLNKEWDNVPKFANKSKLNPTSKPPVSVVLGHDLNSSTQVSAKARRSKVAKELLYFTGPVAPPGRETRVLPSLSTGEGEATKVNNMKYTGTKMMGIATLHKSVAVPVFSAEDAVDISKMRR